MNILVGMIELDLDLVTVYYQVSSKQKWEQLVNVIGKV